MATKAFGMIDALTFGLRALGKNFLLILGLMVGAALAIFAVALCIHTWILPLQVVWAPGAEVAFSAFSVGFNLFVIPAESVDFTFLQLMTLLGACLTLMIIGLVAKMFLLRIGLDSYEYGASSFARLKAALPLVGTFYLTMLLIYFVTGVGILLLIIPGLIFMIKYGFGDFVVLDSDLGPIEALKRSSAITYGHKWRIFGFYALSFLIGALCSILFLGPIFLFVFLFARAYIYRKLVEAKKRDDEQYVPVPQNM